MHVARHNLTMTPMFPDRADSFLGYKHSDMKFDGDGINILVTDLCKVQCSMGTRLSSGLPVLEGPSSCFIFV